MRKYIGTKKIVFHENFKEQIRAEYIALLKQIIKDMESSSIHMPYIIFPQFNPSLTEDQGTFSLHTIETLEEIPSLFRILEEQL